MHVQSFASTLIFSGMPVLEGALFSIGSQLAVALVRAAGQLSRCVGHVNDVRTKGLKLGLMCLQYGYAVLKLFFNCVTFQVSCVAATGDVIPKLTRPLGSLVMFWSRSMNLAETYISHRCLLALLLIQCTWMYFIKTR